jgi:hypothetical protein
VDNETEHDDVADLTPPIEALARLYELRDRYGLAWASELRPTTESERHRAAHGHPLRFGCCAPSVARVA